MEKEKIEQMDLCEVCHRRRWLFTDGYSFYCSKCWENENPESSHSAGFGILWPLIALVVIFSLICSAASAQVVEGGNVDLTIVAEVVSDLDYNPETKTLIFIDDRGINYYIDLTDILQQERSMGRFLILVWAAVMALMLAVTMVAIKYSK